MIEGWRKAFGNSSMPFYFVQLAGFLQPVAVQPDSQWALLRQAQSKALELPSTAMATAIDLGNPVDIHPTNKEEVARRLTMLALDKTYRRPQNCEAPVCTGVRTADGYVELTFNGEIKAEGGVVRGLKTIGPCQRPTDLRPHHKTVIATDPRSGGCKICLGRLSGRKPHRKSVRAPRSAFRHPLT